MSGIFGENTSEEGILKEFPWHEQMTADDDDASANFVKFSNGLLICYSDYMTSQSGDDVTWTFPHAFLSGSKPAISGVSNDGENRFCTPGATIPSNTAFPFKAWICNNFSGSSLGRTTTKYNIMAIGRWK